VNIKNFEKNESDFKYNRLQWNRFEITFISSILQQLLLNPHKLKNFKPKISIKFKPSFINSYSRYQEEIIGIIRRLREDNKTFKEIANILNSKNYKSIRNKQFTPQLIFGIYKKHLIKLEREFEMEIELIKDKTNISK